MLLVLPSRRASIYAPMVQLAIVTIMVALGVNGSLANLGWRWVFGAFVAFNMLVLTLRRIAACQVRGDVIRRWSLVGRRDVWLADVTLGIRLRRFGRRGREYVTIADDGVSQFALSATDSREGAIRDLRRLEDAFALDARLGDESAERRRGRERLENARIAMDLGVATLAEEIDDRGQNHSGWLVYEIMVGLMVVGFAAASLLSGPR